MAIGFHRAALNKFAEGTTTPLEVMTKSISQIQKVNKAYPNSLIITVFVNSKSSEIIDIFKGASQEQKSATYQNMVKLDAAGASKYRSIRR